MKIHSYGAIVIGSKSILLRVYEINPKTGIRVLDSVSHEYELGKEAYLTRKITFTQIEEICGVLNDFKLRMKEYGVTQYRCYATSVVRNARNQIAVLNHIKVRTDIPVTILGNSELRFLMYKGIQISDLDFNAIIQKNTAILDIGSGSVQISLFDKSVLYITQNLDIGTVKVSELLESVQNNVQSYISVMEQYIEREFSLFRKTHLKDKDIKNVIAIGDEIKNLNRIAPELKLSNTLSYEQIKYIFKKVRKASYQDLAMKYGLSMEEARMLLPSVMIYKMFFEQTKADTIYMCRTNLCDGSVVDYAQKEGVINFEHDFYQDILASARYISKRYRANKAHSEFIREVAVQIFDKTVKFHGLEKRDRLLLEISSILHGIGKFVNLNDPGKNGYQLIMSTEIMGISHTEREEVANIVRYNTDALPDIDIMQNVFWREQYLKIAKLSAILRMANMLDRGHKQSYRNMTINRKGKELIIMVETDSDIMLEVSLFEQKAAYFEEIMGIRPVLKQKLLY